MFTVIIADKEYLQKIEEYNLFLKPFLTSPDLALCRWDTEKTGITEMVPDLARTVGRRKDWRAVIICDEKGLNKQNPFDLVDYTAEKYDGPLHCESKDPDAVSEYQAFLEKEHKKKLAAYEQAMENPLTRLVTFFCNSPSVTKEDHPEFSKNDSGYLRYIEENKVKQALRASLLANDTPQTMPPTNIYCIAKRTYQSAAEEFETVWSPHTELEYSRFYDRNMYFDKMRYLIFDILPKTQQGYDFDYVRFLYATLVLGAKDIPNGSLAPERVYRLECENDEEALSRLLQSYEYKMQLTKEELQLKIKDIRDKKPRTLQDKDVRQIFSARPVMASRATDDFDIKNLFADHSKVGLADGCPEDEAIYWDREYKKSQKALAQLLKLSRRAIKKVVRDSRDLEEGIDTSLQLNEFQLEDVRERITAQELAMLQTEIVNLYDEKPFLDRLSREDEKVEKKISQRMYRNPTLIIGALCLVAFILGFVTLFFKSPNANLVNGSLGLIITLVALGAFALAALITLFFLRGGLISKIKDYNNAANGINHSIASMVEQYSKYLSYMNNVRRGYEVLDAAEDTYNPDAGKIILYKKHIGDIEESNLAVRRVFGQYMEESISFDKSHILPYTFNYDRVGDYTYPLPYSEGTNRNITFIHEGNTASVPVDFVKSLIVRREELYE